MQIVGRVSAEVAADLDRLADRAAAEVAIRVPEYHRALVAAGEHPRAAALRTMALLLAGLERREALPSAATSLRREAGLRCESGVPLDVLIEAAWVAREMLGRAFDEVARDQALPERGILGAERRLDRLLTAYVTELARGYLSAFTDRARRQQEAMAALVSVAAAVNRSLELPDVARSALTATATALQVDAAALWLRAPDSAEVVLSYTHGLRWDEDRDLRAAAVEPIRLVERAARAAAPVSGPVGAAGRPLLGSATAVALRSRGELLGVLLAGDRVERVFTAPELALLGSAADHVASAVVRATQHRREARTDALTGLANRFELERQLERAIAGARRHRRPLALVLADLDELKRINDERGHAAGDAALRTVARALEAAVRATDTCARIGGDEFAVVMPEATAEQAADVVQRVDRVLAEAGLQLSLGAAGWAPDLGAAQLFRLADRRLYREKRRHQRQRGDADRDA